MKPEEEAEIILWDWLKTKGENIKEVYFNRINKLNWKTFFVKGKNKKKPDFIIELKNKKYCAVEIKNSAKSKNIIDANKIVDYFKFYVTKETEYYLFEKLEKIDISFFLIATNESPKGYLFQDEKLINNLESKSESKLYITKIGLIPKYEGNRTFEFIRFLWNNYSKIRNN